MLTRSSNQIESIWKSIFSDFGCSTVECVWCVWSTRFWSWRVPKRGQVENDRGCWARFVWWPIVRAGHVKEDSGICSVPDGGVMFVLKVTSSVVFPYEEKLMSSSRWVGKVVRWKSRWKWNIFRRWAPAFTLEPQRLPRKPGVTVLRGAAWAHIEAQRKSDCEKSEIFTLIFGLNRRDLIKKNCLSCPRKFGMSSLVLPSPNLPQKWTEVVTYCLLRSRIRWECQCHK